TTTVQETKQKTNEEEKVVSIKYFEVKEVEGKKEVELTEEAWKHVVFPMDAHEKIESIISKPFLRSMSYSLHNPNVYPGIGFSYPTNIPERMIDGYTYEHNGDPDEIVDDILEKTKLTRSSSYTVHEYNFSGKRAVLYKSIKDFYRSHLEIYSDKFVYDIRVNYYTDDEISTDEEKDIQEILSFAELLNFDVEVK
ncbi:hypothetical protein J9303_19130, partial [Bacillaceae bacterium Marseille-Q3522]|nr:hypothetical protein [Bacillaceae bacterium Marseille-Q3522]